MVSDLPDLPHEAFAKQDTSPDHVFYAQPRFVTHIDGTAIAAVTGLYREVLPPGGVILDLMSSWISHLPEGVVYSAVIGHGLNAAELAANPRLTRSFEQDLNTTPTLPLDTGSVDAVTICVSVQYLQQPAVVLREVARVLRPGGLVVITFSNRCFPTKAVALWCVLGTEDRARLVALYLRHAWFEDVQNRELIPEGGPGDPLQAVVARTAAHV